MKDFKLSKTLEKSLIYTACSITIPFSVIFYGDKGYKMTQELLEELRNKDYDVFYPEK